MVVRNDDVSWQELRGRIEDGEFRRVVVSPGPGSPHVRGDVGVCGDLLESRIEVPVLGVCLGMQLLATTCGARVARAPAPAHGVLAEVRHEGSDLFRGMPSGADYRVVRYHSLAVDEASLPAELRVTAWTDLPPNGPPGQPDRIVMGLAHRSLPRYGVQFHPESVSTERGVDLVRNFLKEAEAWERRAPRPQRSAARPPRGGPVASARVAVSGVEDAAASSAQGQPPLRLSWGKASCPAAATVGGAKALFESLARPGEGGDAFWLDSSSDDKGRFSFFGIPGGPLWSSHSYWRDPEGGAGTMRSRDRHGDAGEPRTPLFPWLRHRLAPAVSAEGLPFDFVGGLVGYLGYELGLEAEAFASGKPSSAPLARPDSGTILEAVPDAAFFFVDRLAVVDRQAGEVYAVAISTPEDEYEATRWVSGAIAAVESLDLSRLEQPSKPECAPPPPDVGLTCRDSQESYERKVLECQEVRARGRERRRETR